MRRVLAWRDAPFTAKNAPHHEAAPADTPMTVEVRHELACFFKVFFEYLHVACGGDHRLGLPHALGERLKRFAFLMNARLE